MPISGKYEMLKDAASTYSNSARRKARTVLSSAQNALPSRKPRVHDLPIPHDLKQAAFAHLFLSNDSPDDQDVKPMTEMLQAMQELSLRQDCLATSAQTSSTKAPQLENGMMMLKSALSPIRRFPQEILQAIFVLHLPTPNTVFPQQYIEADQVAWPWILSQVCRTWRHVALSTPELWTHLPRLRLQRFNSSGDCRRQQEHLEFMIKQSKDLPIHFIIDSETEQLSSSQQSVLDMLVLHAEKWGTITVFARMSVLAALNDVKGRLEQLRRLSLFLSWSPSTIDWDIFSIAPNLQHVFLNGWYHELQLPTTATMTHYEVLLDPGTRMPGIGHGLSSLSTLQTLILQGTSLSPLERTVTLPNLKRLSFRLDHSNVHPGALDSLVLPVLEELVICGNNPHILTTTHSLLRRSASASEQRMCPLAKIHLSTFNAAYFSADDTESVTFISILELAQSLQTMETSLPHIGVLQRLENVVPDEILVPALECLEFVIVSPPSSAQIAALNRIAASRCEIRPQGSPKAVKLLKAFTLYDEYNISSEPRLMRCHRRLEDWWNASEPSELAVAKAPSIASSRSGSADSYGDSSTHLPPSRLDVLRDIIFPVANTGKPGLPVADAFIFKHQHISKQVVGDIISQFDKCKGDAITVIDISVSRIDSVLKLLRSRLQNTSEKTFKRYSHLSDLQVAIDDILNVWYSIINDQLSSVHWVYGDITPGSESVLLCYVPQHHFVRSSEERSMLVLDLDDKRIKFLEEHESICEEFRISDSLRSYPEY